MEPIAAYKVRLYSAMNTGFEAEYLCLIERESVEGDAAVVGLGRGPSTTEAWREAHNSYNSGGLACCNEGL